MKTKSVSVVVTIFLGRFRLDEFTFYNISLEQTCEKILRQSLERAGITGLEQQSSLIFHNTTLERTQSISFCFDSVQQVIKLKLLVDPALLGVPLNIPARTNTSLPASRDSSIADDEIEASVDGLQLGGSDIDNLVLSIDDDMLSLDEPDDAESEALFPEDDFNLTPSEPNASDDPSGSQFIALDECDLFSSGSDATMLQGGADFSPVADGDGDKQVAIVDGNLRVASVRYFTRMNLGRLHPLLVVIDKDTIDKLTQKSVAHSSSSSFTLDNSKQVVVELILPGCECFPPKISATLSGGRLSARFHILPKIQGEIEDAGVTIIQSEKTLAHIPLKIFIAERFWVTTSAALTVLMPALSTYLDYFNIGFSQSDVHSQNIYLSAAHLLFEGISPLNLTILLFVITGFLWMKSKPKSKDVFWDIRKENPKKPEVRELVPFTQLPETRTSPTDAENCLKQLFVSDKSRFYEKVEQELKENPGNLEVLELKARGLLIDCRYTEATSCYQRLNDNNPHELRFANQLAYSLSKAGRRREAISVLERAIPNLDKSTSSPLLLYNLGCYYSLEGRIKESITFLNRAYDTGYRNANQFFLDPDLKILKGEIDFQNLLRKPMVVRINCPRCKIKIEFDSGYKNKNLLCGKCGQSFQFHGFR